MKRFLLVLALGFLASGCAHAAPVTLSWINPTFNALPGTCSGAVDSLKDLSRVDVYRGTPGVDSTLVLSKPEAGRERLSETVTVQQPEGTFTYWVISYDLLGNQSCRSNTATKSVILTPTGITTLQ